MLDGFKLSIQNAAWPLLAGLLVLAFIRRQPPAGWWFRICGVYAALLLYAVAVSSRLALWLLWVVGVLLGLILIAFKIEPE